MIHYSATYTFCPRYEKSIGHATAFRKNLPIQSSRWILLQSSLISIDGTYISCEMTVTCVMQTIGKIWGCFAFWMHLIVRSWYSGFATQQICFVRRIIIFLSHSQGLILASDSCGLRCQNPLHMKQHQLRPFSWNKTCRGVESHFLGIFHCQILMQSGKCQY